MTLCHPHAADDLHAARRAGDQRGSAAREVREGGRAQHRRCAPARRPRPGRSRGAGSARNLGGALPASADRRLHPGRAHQLGSRDGALGHPHQLLRAAGRRFDRAGRRGPSRHLHRAHRGGRDDAARRRRRLRLLAHPAARSLGRQHAVERLGPGVVHARVRPLVRDRRVGRLAAWRADGRAALRPSRHRGVHPRQGQGRPGQLQHLGRPHRRVHAGGRRWRGHRSRAPRGTRAASARRRRALARRRRVDLPHPAGARALAADHALHLRPRRAGRSLPRPDQPRQQPLLLRDDRGDEPLRRAAAAAVRLLLPRLDRPDPLRPRRVRAGGALRRGSLRPPCPDRGPDARQRPRHHVLAAAAARRGGAQQAPRRPRLHRSRRRAGDARPALRHRSGAGRGAPHRRGAARLGLRRIGRPRRRARRVSALQRRHGAEPRHVRLAPSGGAQGAHPRVGPAQLAPALDRPDRNHQPGVRRQREQRNRASVLVDATRAGSEWPTARSRSTRSRTTRGACSGT